MAVITYTCILHNKAIMFNEEAINSDPEENVMDIELLIHSEIYLQLLSFPVHIYYFYNQCLYTLISDANKINGNDNQQHENDDNSVVHLINKYFGLKIYCYKINYFRFWL